MKVTCKYLVTLSLGFVVLPLVLAGCGFMKEPCPQPADDGAVRGLVVARAQAVSVATSALESIDRGEMDVTRSTLEAQVSSGLTVLYTLRSEARKEDSQLITEAIQEAESYAKRKGLHVVRPDGASPN
jgi:hypothetical protein